LEEQNKGCNQKNGSKQHMKEIEEQMKGYEEQIKV
jgi:hypothetical protein